jgi:hypothetical protein
MLKYKVQSIKPLNKLNDYINYLKKYALNSTKESILKKEEYYKNNKYQIMLNNNLYKNSIQESNNLIVTPFLFLSISSLVTYYFIKKINVFST